VAKFFGRSIDWVGYRAEKVTLRWSCCSEKEMACLCLSWKYESSQLPTVFSLICKLYYV